MIQPDKHLGRGQHAASPVADELAAIQTQPIGAESSLTGARPALQHLVNQIAQNQSIKLLQTATR
jgi:hypothetical protein